MRPRAIVLGVALIWLSARWVCILRSHGLSGYRAATPFFYGLTLGEFTVGCSWTVLGMALSTPTYESWP